jgi:hypothetical protein
MSKYRVITALHVSRLVTPETVVGWIVRPRWCWLWLAQVKYNDLKLDNEGSFGKSGIIGSGVPGVDFEAFIANMYSSLAGQGGCKASSQDERQCAHTAKDDTEDVDQLTLHVSAVTSLMLFTHTWKTSMLLGGETVFTNCSTVIVLLTLIRLVGGS